MIHAPRSFRTTGYLVDWIGRGETPLAIVAPENLTCWDRLVPEEPPFVTDGEHLMPGSFELLEFRSKAVGRNRFKHERRQQEA
jgi:hypothetical protein